MWRFPTCCFGFTAVLVCLLGADTVTMTSSTPNPKGAKNTAEGKGTYGVDPANTFDSLEYTALLVNTTQLTHSAATRDNPNPGDWYCTLILAPATYDTYTVLTTEDKKTSVLYFTKTKTTQIIVK
ncbi:MAG: hypothetical protein K2X87_27275 [Gemmataceae bacterium]|nr:hypothetical protein [Gemmataceae bacterium]